MQYQENSPQNQPISTLTKDQLETVQNLITHMTKTDPTERIHI